ncbi:uncharacterized protein BXZ73DRAFT_81239, partial [Epithele typhae]|uniref:uncharacterized protein n=1 Tax=Epithele typhae TaxID=378194 RepID=UPI00200771D0
LRAWGTKVWTRTRDARKLDARGKLGHFVGFSEQYKDAILVYWPDRRTVTVERSFVYEERTPVFEFSLAPHKGALGHGHAHPAPNGTTLPQNPIADVPAPKEPPATTVPPLALPTAFPTTAPTPTSPSIEPHAMAEEIDEFHDLPDLYLDPVEEQEMREDEERERREAEIRADLDKAHAERVRQAKAQEERDTAESSSSKHPPSSNLGVGIAYASHRTTSDASPVAKAPPMAAMHAFHAASPRATSWE